MKIFKYFQLLSNTYACKLFSCFHSWDLCSRPFSAFIGYNAIKRRVTLQVFCQDKAIINILKKIKYNLPNGIKQDVTMVSNDIFLSVYFPMSYNSADLIEGYKNEIIQQMLANVSNHGYKLKYNSLCRKHQHLALVHPKCIKECRNRMIATK